MRCTPNVASPVITLLTKNPSASRRTQLAFQSLFSLEPLNCNPPSKGDENLSSVTKSDNASIEARASDDIDNIFPKNVPGLKMRWNSIASRCPGSGTIFHFLSLSGDGPSSDPPTAQSDVSSTYLSGEALALLSITPGPLDDTYEQSNQSKDGNRAVWESRRILASHIKQTRNGTFGLACKLSFQNALGKSIDFSTILGRKSNGLPLIKFPDHGFKGNDVNEPNSNNNAADSRSAQFKLREIVLPHFDDASYSDGTTLLSTFSKSGLKRPLIGLYQWPSSSKTKDGDGVAFRPLPAAQEDMSLPAPTFVFHCESFDDAKKTLDDAGALTAKVGFGGAEKSGQLMIGHNDLKGLDVRLCMSKEFSKFFAEAQESLLAGSLDELQSVNVLQEGGKAGSQDEPRSDSMNGLGDCWVEFRANMKRPSGFLKNLKTSLREQKKGDGASKRVAKPPDLPYE